MKRKSFIILSAISFYMFLVPQAEADIIIEPPFAQAQSYHEVTDIEYNLGIAKAYSIYGPPGSIGTIDQANGIIDQNAHTDAQLLEPAACCWGELDEYKHWPHYHDGVRIPAFDHDSRCQYCSSV
jgi:hypothetical protein